MQALERINEALKLIVCPVCHGQLVLPGQAAIDIVICLGCSRRYPIEDGIPVLLEARASLPR